MQSLKLLVENLAVTNYEANAMKSSYFYFQWTCDKVTGMKNNDEVFYWEIRYQHLTAIFNI